MTRKLHVQIEPTDNQSDSGILLYFWLGMKHGEKFITYGLK